VVNPGESAAEARIEAGKESSSRETQKENPERVSVNGA